MWQKSGTVPPKAGRLAGLVLRNTVANKLNASLQIVGDDNVCAQTGVLKYDKTEENTFEILQHSDRNINNS